MSQDAGTFADRDAFEDALCDLAHKVVPGATGIGAVRRLSGGASQETWSFEALGHFEPKPLILRRSPAIGRTSPQQIGLPTEAKLMRLAGEAGVPSPRVRTVLKDADNLGEGFLMDRVEGETLGRRIVRDPAFDAARRTLAHRCGEVLAAIHRIPPPAELELRTADQQLAALAESYRALGWNRPVFALALKWLEKRLPRSPVRPALVHGDFRNGNLIVAPDGLKAVLDWELAHVGDPMEDLGWICTGSWRFGEIDKPVGGFGELADLFAGYGEGVDPERVKFWEAMGSLRWGLMCSGSAVRAAEAPDSVERPVIARRASETEIDLVNIMDA